MEESRFGNYAMLRGAVPVPPAFSHESRGERFYRFSLDVCRLSGAVDSIHIIARESLLESLEPNGAEALRVVGELRSFNNKSGVGPRLVITVFARELYLENGADENRVELSGVLCRPPVYRVTPLGREICDFMLAVRRRYCRSDYLPCIAWGASARAAAQWPVGAAVRLEGRIQSRVYQKTENGVALEKVAYEVSIIRILPISDA